MIILVARLVLTLEEWMNKRFEKGETAVAISWTFVGKTQIQSLIKDKDTIIRRWESGESSYRKFPKKVCLYSDLDERLWEWLFNTRPRNIPISGYLIKEKDRLLTEQSGNSNFTASNEWLEKCSPQHNVRTIVLDDESGDFPQQTVDEWSARLPSMCEGYDPKNIFNICIYRALPSRLMVAKGESIAGFKTLKDRDDDSDGCKRHRRKTASSCHRKFCKTKVFPWCRNVFAQCWLLL